MSGFGRSQKNPQPDQNSISICSRIGIQYCSSSLLPMHHTKFILDCCLSFFLPPLCKCLSIFLSFFLSSSCISLFFFCTDLSPSFFVFRCSFYQKLSCLQLHALTLTINSFHLFAFLSFSLHFFDIFNTASVPIMCKLSSHPLRIPFLPSWSFSLPNSSLFTSVVHLLSFFP